MSAATSADLTPRLLLGDVHQGDELPQLRYPVTATTVVLGALASRDWRPMHHDHDFAVKRNGTKDIFLNTPNQAAWFERYLTDWTGPHGRLAHMSFRSPPGSRIAFLTGLMKGVFEDEKASTYPANPLSPRTLETNPTHFV